jgi:hypothetical protein
MNARVMRPLPIFIVILDEVLVAQDIEMIISDIAPDAAVVVARTFNDPNVRVPEGRIVAAFVQGDLAQFKASTIGAQVMADGARLVLVGQEPAASPQGVVILPYPFAAGDVGNLVNCVAQAC